jgi:hypothetical protein
MGNAQKLDGQISLAEHREAMRMVAVGYVWEIEAMRKSRNAADDEATRLTIELAEARRQVARADELLVAAEEWMSADGCDCGTDEIDACSLCRIRAFLAAAQQAKEGGKSCQK